MSDAVARLNAALSGRYLVERQLGEGGSASVYLCRDLRHKRHVALKVLKPELAAVIGADRFLAEIETTARLQHPRIVPLFDSGKADSLLFFVMPYIEGESLRQKLDREGLLPLDEAVDVVAKVGEALDYAHAHGLLHRDIKPGNILLSRGGPILSDFGIARALGGAAEVKRGGRTFHSGTPQYMSVEQLAGDPDLDERSDVYSLACVLYEALAGEVPQRASTAQGLIGKRVEETHRPLAELRVGVPPHVDDALTRALRWDRSKRTATVRSFVHELQAPRADVATEQGSPRAQIVLFPLTNDSVDEATSRFCDALAIETQQMLSSVRDLKVVQADTGFRSESDSLHDVGARFGASHALTGHAHFVGDQYEIEVALARVEDEATLWSDRFEGQLKSGSESVLRDRIASAVVGRLPAGLHLPPRFAARPSADAESLFWDAQSAWKTRSPEKLLTAKQLFRKATEADRKFASGYVGIANVCCVLGGADYATHPPAELYPEAWRMPASSTPAPSRPCSWSSSGRTASCPTSRTRSSRAPAWRTAARWSTTASRACSSASGPGAGIGRIVQPASSAFPDMLENLIIFVLAAFVGFEIIAKVPQTLHTPLMSGSNAISGITVVGALVAAGMIADPWATWLGFGALVVATINVVGGFLVTDRMLQMFKKKPREVKAPDEKHQAAADRQLART